METLDVESHWRTPAKCLSWRLASLTITGLVTWWVTGRTDLAATISLADFAVKTGGLYVHERLWLRLPIARAAGTALPAAPIGPAGGDHPKPSW